MSEAFDRADSLSWVWPPALANFVSSAKSDWPDGPCQGQPGLHELSCNVHKSPCVTEYRGCLSNRCLITYPRFSHAKGTTCTSKDSFWNRLVCSLGQIYTNCSLRGKNLKKCYSKCGPQDIFFSSSSWTWQQSNWWIHFLMIIKSRTDSIYGETVSMVQTLQRLYNHRYTTVYGKGKYWLLQTSASNIDSFLDYIGIGLVLTHHNIPLLSSVNRV